MKKRKFSMNVGRKRFSVAMARPSASRVVVASTISPCMPSHCLYSRSCRSSWMRGNTMFCSGLYL